MKTIIARFAGTCFECGKRIAPGHRIKYYGRLHCEHADCANPTGQTDSQRAVQQTAPCWICGSPNGKFRSMGAATPVWCDACNAARGGQTAADLATPAA